MIFLINKERILQLQENKNLRMHGEYGPYLWRRSARSDCDVYIYNRDSILITVFFFRDPSKENIESAISNNLQEIEDIEYLIDIVKLRRK